MAIYTFDSAAKLWKRNFTFVDGSNYGHKSGGVNGTFDAFAVGKKYLSTWGLDQSARWLTKNYSQLWAIGLGSVPSPDFNLLPACFYGEQANGNLRVYEFGVLKTTVTNKVNENSEPRIQIESQSGVLKLLYKIRDGVGQAENLIWTSTMTDAQIKALFPLFFVGCFGGYVSGTPNTSAGFEFAQIEADADKVGDLLEKVSITNPPIKTPLLSQVSFTGGNKELPNHQLIYSGENLPTARNGILTFKAMKDWGAIKGMRLSVFDVNATDATQFNIRKNNTNLFTTELTIPANQKQIDLTGLDISVTANDEFIVDYKTVGKTVKTPIILELTIDA